MLVASIETLITLGANPNEADKVGNTALHKAIAVCTSKSVVPVVECLLRQGAGASCKYRNREGDGWDGMGCDVIRCVM